MKQNILLFMDTDREATLALKSTHATNYNMIPYYVQSGSSGVTLVAEGPSPTTDNVRLGVKLKRLLQDVEVQSK